MKVQLVFIVMEDVIDRGLNARPTEVVCPSVGSRFDGAGVSFAVTTNRDANGTFKAEIITATPSEWEAPHDSSCVSNPTPLGVY